MMWTERRLLIILLHVCGLRLCIGANLLLFVSIMWWHQYEIHPSFETVSECWSPTLVPVCNTKSDYRKNKLLRIWKNTGSRSTKPSEQCKTRGIFRFRNDGYFRPWLVCQTPAVPSSICHIKWDAQTHETPADRKAVKWRRVSVNSETERLWSWAVAATFIGCFEALVHIKR